MGKQDPFYLAAAQNVEDDVSIEEIPISELDLSHMDKPEKKSKKSKKDKKNAGAAPEDRPAVVVKKFMDEPDGDDSPQSRGNSKDALDIDLSGPLRKDEVLKETKEYKMTTAEDAERDHAKAERAKKREEKSNRRKKRDEEKLEEMGDEDMLMGDQKPKKSSTRDKKSSKKEVKEKKSKKVKKDKADPDDDLMGDLLGSNTTAPAKPSNSMDDIFSSMDISSSATDKKAKKSRAPVTLTSRISAAGATKDAYEAALTGGSCGCAASGKIKLPKEKIQLAIEQIAAHLHVEMVDC